MTRFQIDYNPYMVRYRFFKNGQPLPSNSRIGKVEDRKKRIQALLMPSDNWNGLAEEIAKYCNYVPEIQVCFRGRKMDYEDLEYCFKDYKGKTKFTLSLEETQKETDVSARLDQFFQELKNKRLPEFEKKNRDGKNVFDIYEETKNNIFYISVIATMSSGKSTLINALLHTDLLPAKNEACTAQITRILDHDEMKDKGYTAVCYGSDGKTILHEDKEISPDQLAKYNAEPDVKYIDITGDIPEISSDKIRLCLRDTPGPNNSQDKTHEAMTDEIIKETNAIVLYVINAEQQGITDDQNLLKKISEEMKRAGKESRDRFIFVLNKCDTIDEEKESLENYLENVRIYLNQFGIQDPILIPTSARLALLVRKERRGGQLTRAERKDIKQVEDFVKISELHFEENAVLTPTIRGKMQKKVEEYHADEATWDLEAVIHTGVPAVQETIMEYLEKYAFPMKVFDALDEVSGIIKQIIQDFEFDQSVVADEKRLKIIQSQIAEAKNKFDKSAETLNRYQDELNCLSLRPEMRRRALEKVQKDMERLSREYDQRQIEKSKADTILKEFEGRLEKFQIELEQDLGYILEEEVFQKGNKMHEQYMEDIGEFLSEIKIEGYDFKKVRAINSYTIPNLDKLIEENTEEKTHTETRWRDNPKKRGFFGKLKFWQPKRTSYIAEVLDGEFVNMNNIIVNVMFEFSEIVRKNIEDIFDQAERQLKEYVGIFCNNLNGLREEINQLLNQKEKDMRDEKEIRERVQKNKENEAWLKEKQRKLEEILNF